MFFWLSAALLTAAVLLGGSPRTGFTRDVVVQLLAIVVLLACLWRATGKSNAFGFLRGPADRPLLLIAAIGFLVILLQLLPLPPGLSLSRLQGLNLSPEVGDPFAFETWRGLSLVPEASWAALASLLPPIALFAAVTQLHAVARFRLAALVIGLCALALVLGFLQAIQGPQSALRLFTFTNPTEAVGFFANRNHFASQLYTALIFAAVWFAFTAKNFVRFRDFDSRAIFWLAAATVLLIGIIAGLALARSRAGILLAAAAIAGILAMFWVDRRASKTVESSSTRFMRLTMLGTLGAAVLFAAQFGLHRVLTRFEGDPLSDLRFTLSSATLETALANLPFGTGIGSFVRVYLVTEDPNALFGAYANRAHNDWIELLLETGLFGIAIAVLFLWWFARKAIAVWRPISAEDPERHLTLQRAATLVILLLLMHSLVDYPLRTTAMACIFAFTCAILVAAPPSPPRPDAPAKRASRRASSRPDSPPPQDAEEQAWDSDIQWPDAWKPQNT